MAGIQLLTRPELLQQWGTEVPGSLVLTAGEARLLIADALQAHALRASLERLARMKAVQEGLEVVEVGLQFRRPPGWRRIVGRITPNRKGQQHG